MYEYPPEVEEYRQKVYRMNDGEVSAEVHRVDKMNEHERSAKWYIKNALRSECQRRNMPQELQVIIGW